MPSVSLDHLLCETILHAEQQQSRQKTWMLLSPLAQLCVQSESWLYMTLLAPENISYFIFCFRAGPKLLVKGASTAKALMREICRATVSATVWHVIESRLLAAMYDIDNNHSPRSWPPSLWSALIDRGWSSGIDKCGFQVDPLLHRWLWLTPQVDSRPN